MTECSIREIRSTDSPRRLDELSALFKQLSPMSAAVTAKRLNMALRSPSVTVVGVFKGDELIGMGTLVLVPLITKTVAVIHDVVILESERGKGLAKKLMQNLLERAEQQGALYCDLTSNPARIPANGLYQSLGFGYRNTNDYRLHFH